jgi:hypothetical protein
MHVSKNILHSIHQDNNSNTHLFQCHLEDFLNNKQYGISIIKIHYQFYATLHN